MSKGVRLLGGAAAVALLAGTALFPAPARAAEMPACTIEWTGQGGTFAWTTAGNWSLGRLPGSADHVCIPDMPGDLTISIGSGYNAVKSLRSLERIQITGSGQLALTDTTAGVVSSVNRLSLTGGSLRGQGALSVSEALEFTGGSMTDNGSVTVEPNATMTVSGTAQKTLGKVLINSGTINWTEGDLWGSGSGRLNNSGQISLSTGSLLKSSYSYFLLQNEGAGTITKTGTGTFKIAGSFDNDGAANVEAGGVLVLWSGTPSGGSHAGSFVVDGLLQFDSDGSYNATNQLGATSSVSGPGQVDLIRGSIHTAGSWAVNTTQKGAYVEFKAAATIPTLVQESGTMAGTGTVSVTESFTWISGSQYGAGTLRVESGATALVQGAGERSASNYRQIINDGTMTVASDIRTGGSTIINNGTLLLQDDADLLNDMYGVATLTNSAGAQIQKTSGTGVSLISMKLQNDGQISLTSGTLELSGSNDAVQTGSMTVDGALVISGGKQNLGGASAVTGSGSVSVTNGTAMFGGSYAVPTLTVTGGSAYFTGGTVLESVTQSGGWVFFNGGTATVTDVAQAGGLFGGKGTVTITGAYDWTGGQQHDSGTTVIAEGATLTLSGTADKTISSGHTIKNLGTVNWNEGRIYGSGSTFENAGLLRITGDGNWDVNYGTVNSLKNNGTLRRDGGAGSVVINAGATNSGTIEVATGGLSLPKLSNLASWALTGGSYQVKNGSTLALSSIDARTLKAHVLLDGAGAAIRTSSGGDLFANLAAIDSTGRLTLTSGSALSTAVSLTNNGIVELGGGSSLNVNGDYAEAGTLRLDLVPDNGRLQVGGTANLTGKLDLGQNSGLAAGQAYPIMTYGSRTGSLATVSEVGGGILVDARYEPAELIIRLYTPVAVTAVNPVDGAAGVPVKQPVTITFDRNVTVDASKVLLMQGGSPVAAGVAVSGDTVTITPEADLAYDVTYTVWLAKDAVVDEFGYTLAYDRDFTFTTGPDDLAPVWPAASSLVVSDVTETTLLLTWTAASDTVGVAGYRLYKDDVAFLDLGADQLSTLVDGLTADTTYTFRVEAYDAAGNESSTGPSTSATTLPVPTAERPTWAEGSSLTYTAGTGKGGQRINLTWTPAEGEVTAYRVYANGTLVAEVDGDTTAVSVFELDPGVTYTFQVQAGNAEGAWSEDGPTVVAEKNWLRPFVKGGKKGEKAEASEETPAEGEEAPAETEPQAEMEQP